MFTVLRSEISGTLPPYLEGTMVFVFDKAAVINILHIVEIDWISLRQIGEEIGSTHT